MNLTTFVAPLIQKTEDWDVTPYDLDIKWTTKTWEKPWSAPRLCSRPHFWAVCAKALDKTAPTTAAQSAAATHSTTKRLKTGKSSKAKDTNDEDDGVDLQLDDDDYDTIIQNQQQDVEAGPASQNPSTKDGSKKQSKHTRGAKRCTFEKTRPWNVTLSGVDTDWTTKLVVYMKSMGDGTYAKASEALQQILVSVFSLDGVRHASELAKSLRES